jgi:hypothetical protein
MKHGLARKIAWSIWIAVSLQVALIVLEAILDVTALQSPMSIRLPHPVRLSDTLVSILTVLSFPAVGLLVYIRRPENPMGWIFCWTNIGWAINNCAGSLVRNAIFIHPEPPILVRSATWLYAWTGFFSIGLTLLLVLLFPSGRLPSYRWRPVAWASVLAALLGAVITAFAPGPSVANSPGLIDPCRRRNCDSSL